MMSWIQFGILLVVGTTVAEITFRRVKKLLHIRGDHEAALDALAGRLNLHGQTLDGHAGRIERVERELHLR
jgi:hypothetical protein